MTAAYVRPVMTTAYVCARCQVNQMHTDQFCEECFYVEFFARIASGEETKEDTERLKHLELAAEQKRAGSCEGCSFSEVRDRNSCLKCEEIVRSAIKLESPTHVKNWTDFYMEGSTLQKISAFQVVIRDRSWSEDCKSELWTEDKYIAVCSLEDICSEVSCGGCLKVAKQALISTKRACNPC